MSEPAPARRWPTWVMLAAVVGFGLWSAWRTVVAESGRNVFENEVRARLEAMEAKVKAAQPGTR